MSQLSLLSRTGAGLPANGSKQIEDRTCKVDFGSENAIARLQQNVEQAVRKSGAAWTFLRPGAFMAYVFQWADSIRSGGDVRIPFGDITSPSIDSRDIAEKIGPQYPF